MAYQPTAEDFDIPDEEGYQPSAEDFEESGAKPLELELTKGVEPKELKGWKGLGHDAVELLRNTLKGGIGFAKRAPGNLKEIGSELIQHPLSYPPHIAQQVLAGLTEGGKGLLNIVPELSQEFAKKEITPDWAQIPAIPEDTGVEKFLGLEPTKKSDELLRALPALYGGGRLAAKPLGALKRKVTAPSKEMMFQRALEKRIDAAAKDTAMSESQLKDLKESLRRDYSKIHQAKAGEVTPIGQEEAINVKQGKIDKLKSATEIPEEAIGEIPEAPDTQAIIDKKKAALEKATADAEEVVGIKDNPRLKGSKPIKKAIEEVHDTSDALYKSARAHYVDQKIQANNGAEIKAVTKDLEALKDADELAPGYGSGTPEQKALQSQLDSLKGEKVNASDIFDLQRTLEKMAEDTRTKQFSGVNDIEFKRLNSLAERLDSHAGALEKRLESVGGKEVQSMIKEANKGWKTWKDLSKRNPVGKGALKGEIPTRSMIERAKDHPGNDFVSALVESNPEIKKHMLAAYAGESNVNKLLKPTSLAKKYIQDLPEVEEHVNALKQALTGVKEGEIEASKVKKEYGDLVKSMTDAAERQKVRQDAIKESDKLKKQIDFHEKAIPKLEEKIKTVDQKSKEHGKLVEELKAHKQNLMDKNHLLKKATAMILKVTGASSLMHKAGL